MDERDENGGAGEYADIDFGYECDLHFFEPRETAAVVREFIRQATQKGLSTVRLVHGKGKSAKKTGGLRYPGFTPRRCIIQERRGELGGDHHHSRAEGFLIRSITDLSKSRYSFWLWM